MVVGVHEIGAMRASVRDGRATRLLRRGPLQQLVEFPAVEPDAAARWTVVDLDALSV